MLSVKNNEDVLIIKNSKFICLIYQVNTINEINNYLDNVRKLYKDATHYCYAYILDGDTKCSDDGEPAGTAGIPMLQVLQKNNLDHVLCIVVRYFGKILLGASGLVRAYSKSVSQCVNNNIIELVKGFNIDISFDYSYLKQIDYLLKDINIINKNFEDIVTYNLNVSEDLYNDLKNSKICKIKINNNTYL